MPHGLPNGVVAWQVYGFKAAPDWVDWNLEDVTFSQPSGEQGEIMLEQNELLATEIQAARAVDINTYCLPSQSAELFWLVIDVNPAKEIPNETVKVLLSPALCVPRSCHSAPRHACLSERSPHMHLRCTCLLFVSVRVPLAGAPSSHAFPRYRDAANL